jgi:hypothetical protein
MTESAVYGLLTITWVFVMCSIVYRWCFMECVNSYKLLVSIYMVLQAAMSPPWSCTKLITFCVLVQMGTGGCVCVGHQCLFSPAKFFHQLVNLEIGNAFNFLNRVFLGIVF